MLCDSVFSYGRKRQNDKLRENSFSPTTQWKIKFENDRAALKLKNETWKSVKQFVNQNQVWKRMEMNEATSKCVKKVLGMWSGGNEIFILLENRSWLTIRKSYYECRIKKYLGQGLLYFCFRTLSFAMAIQGVFSFSPRLLYHSFIKLFE